MARPGRLKAYVISRLEEGEMDMMRVSNECRERFPHLIAGFTYLERLKRDWLRERGGPEPTLPQRLHDLGEAEEGPSAMAVNLADVLEEGGKAQKMDWTIVRYSEAGNPIVAFEDGSQFEIVAVPYCGSVR